MGELQNQVEDFITKEGHEGSEQEKLDEYSSEARHILHNNTEWLLASAGERMSYLSQLKMLPESNWWKDAKRHEIESADEFLAFVDRLITEKVGLLPVPDEHEHIVDINHPEIRKAIQVAEQSFDRFERGLGTITDLSKPESIDRALEAAEQCRIYEKAQKIRELIYDKNISIYGVSYLSNACNNNCTFCPIGIANLEAQQAQEELDNSPDLTPDRRDELQWIIYENHKKILTLTPEEAAKDFDALGQIGHQEICILAGEKIGDDPDLIIQYANLAAQTPGIKEIILNMGNYSEGIFQYIRDGIKLPEGVKLQHRVFQETYNAQYFHYLKHSPQQGGKYNWDQRYESQISALKVGFDEVGIGALFGLMQWPIIEVKSLRNHAKNIEEQGGKEPKRCCLPFGNEPDYLHVDIPYMIPKMARSKEITRLIYTLARLAMPTVSIVSSERDDPEILDELDSFANQTTLFVHPAPGKNTESLVELAGGEKTAADKIEQAKTIARHPSKAIKSWIERGYHILDFDWKKYIDTEIE